MGFLDALQRALGGENNATRADRRDRLGTADAFGAGGAADDGAADGTPDPARIAAPPETTDYDRTIWLKKLQHILTERPTLPATEYADFLADAQALGFDREWVEQSQRSAFEMLVRKIVSDGVVTMEEHTRLDQARRLIGLTDPEAVSILEKVVAEAQEFFGKEIEGA
jgi:hypothetical protein